MSLRQSGFPREGSSKYEGVYQTYGPNTKNGETDFDRDTTIPHDVTSENSRVLPGSGLIKTEVTDCIPHCSISESVTERNYVVLEIE